MAGAVGGGRDGIAGSMTAGPPGPIPRGVTCTYAVGPEEGGALVSPAVAGLHIHSRVVDTGWGTTSKRPRWNKMALGHKN